MTENTNTTARVLHVKQGHELCVLDPTGGFIEKAVRRIPNPAQTVGQFKEQVALQAGVNADDLMVLDTLRDWLYDLPDFVSCPEFPYVCFKPFGLSSR